MNKITANDLKKMERREGLILQGCGGDPQEWLDGINDLLTAEGILLNGSIFENASVFECDGITDILLDFEDVEMEAIKLAMWRLQTHAQFGGTWLSDFVPNKLGDFEQAVEKPDCALIGEDGNIFNLIGLAARTLRRNGQAEQAKEMQKRIMGGGCNDYYEALDIIGEYVNITSAEEMEQGGMEWGEM